MKKNLLLTLSITLLLIGCGATEKDNLNKEEKSKLPEKTVQQELTNNEQDIVAQAKDLYKEKKDSGINLKDGPCLGIINTDWAVDIVNHPRLPIDNRANNQCTEYRNNTISHIIELDLDGEFIRMK